MVDREIPSFGHEAVVESDPSTMKEVMLLVGGATFGLRDYMALPKGHPEDTISGLIGNVIKLLPLSGHQYFLIMCLNMFVRFVYRRAIVPRHIPSNFAEWMQSRGSSVSG